MSHIVHLDNSGRLVYDGMLSSQGKASVDDILCALQQEIPQIESELESVYGQTVMYKYHLGLLTKYEITISEQRDFWDEIKQLATNEDRKRKDGKESVTRSFYQQCYILSQQDSEVVGKLSWRQWQDILDRVGNREDPRIFQWIKGLPEKIREDDWREFEKALHLFLKNKDTTVFNDEEFFLIYDSIMDMCKAWRIKFKEFSERHPKSAKIKTKGTWAKKYYAECYALKKQRKMQTVTKDIYDSAFNEIMKN